MKKIFLAISLIFATVNNAFSLTLDEAIDLAKKDNLELKSQEYSYKAAKSEKLKSLGGFLPKASVSARSGSRRTRIGDNPRINSDIDSKTFSASQNLFDGFGSTFKLKEANNILKREKAAKDSKSQQITLGVVRTYLDGLRYKKLLEIGEENLESQKNLLSYIKRRFGAKDATRAEIAKAKADFIRAKNDCESNRNSLNFAKENLARYLQIDISQIDSLEEVELGDMSTENMDLEADLIASENKSQDEIQGEAQNLEEMFIDAVQNNPEVRIAKYEHGASVYRSKASKSALAPQVNLNFEISEQENSLYLGNQKERDKSIYLNVTVPIFTSGLNYFNISSTSNARKSERYRYEAMKRQIRNSVIEYHTQQKNLEANYRSAKELEKANEVYMLTLKKEERLGTRSIIELLEVKQDLYRSKIEVINLYYEKIYNKFELDALLGRLI